MIAKLCEPEVSVVLGFGVLSEDELTVELGREDRIPVEWAEVDCLLVWEECAWGGCRGLPGGEGKINCPPTIWTSA